MSPKVPKLDKLKQSVKDYILDKRIEAHLNKIRTEIQDKITTSIEKWGHIKKIRHHY